MSSLVGRSSVDPSCIRIGVSESVRAALLLGGESVLVGLRMLENILLVVIRGSGALLSSPVPEELEEPGSQRNCEEDDASYGAAHDGADVRLAIASGAAGIVPASGRAGIVARRRTAAHDDGGIRDAMSYNQGQRYTFVGARANSRQSQRSEHST